MLKTKKELMLELGKLNLELTDIKTSLANIISYFGFTSYEATQDSLRILYSKITGGKQIMPQITVEGYGIILTSSCRFNGISEQLIPSKVRKRELVFARAFYCLLCLELGLRTENELASDINRDRCTIAYYRKMYETDVTFRKRYDAFVNSMM